jgi:ribose 5-phosphate isomerase A
VTGLDFGDPLALELELEALPGVVACGIFARRPADVVLAGTPAGVRVLERP